MNMQIFCRVTDRITVSEQCREEVLHMAMQKHQRHTVRRHLLGALAGAVLAGALGGAVLAGARGGPTVFDADGQPVPHMHTDYPVNSSGQTYGTAKDAVYIEDYPQLLAAIGDHGISGYIYLADMLGEDPASPQEAIRQQEARQQAIRDGTYHPRVIPVYDADGKTQVDTMTCG